MVIVFKKSFSNSSAIAASGFEIFGISEEDEKEFNGFTVVTFRNTSNLEIELRPDGRQDERSIYVIKPNESNTISLTGRRNVMVVNNDAAEQLDAEKFFLDIIQVS